MPETIGKVYRKPHKPKLEPKPTHRRRKLTAKKARARARRQFL